MDRNFAARQDINRPQMKRNKSIEVVLHDISEPIDQIKASRNVSNSYNLFFKMIDKMSSMNLQPNMRKVANAVNEMNWHSLIEPIINIKEATVYVGAGRLQYMCFHMLTALHLNETDKILTHYQMLVELCIEYVRFTKRTVASYESKFYRKSHF